jgi:hypothetical protein
MSFTCPICKVERPEEHHLDWCTYEGPEPEELDSLDRVDEWGYD